jgi:hypothetical protein
MAEHLPPAGADQNAGHFPQPALPERPGVGTGVDQDGDGFVNELTRADINGAQHCKKIPASCPAGEGGMVEEIQDCTI